MQVELAPLVHERLRMGLKRVDGKYYPVYTSMAHYSKDINTRDHAKTRFAIGILYIGEKRVIGKVPSSVLINGKWIGREVC